MPYNKAMKKYFEELDSLRGLAALSVLIHHFLLVLPIIDQNTFGSQNWVNIIKYSPLHFFWFGYEPVLFFFVLSGFVMALSFYAKPTTKYSTFLLKRFFRIYIPYYVAVAVAMTLYSVLSRHGIPELSHWFNSLWIQPITVNTIFNHLLLIKYFGFGQYVPVLWTLAVEVRISLLFPFLMKFIARSGWKTGLVISLGMSALYYLLRSSGLEQLLSFIPSDYFYTLSFISMFLAGAVLAKYHHQIANYVRKMSKTKKILLIISAGLLYTSRYWLFLSEGVNGTHTFLSDTVITLGIAMVIILSISTRLSTILQFRPLVIFGKMSYSVYLYHAVILVACIYLFYSKFPLPWIWMIAFITTLLTSFASYTWIEKNSLQLSKFLPKKLRLDSK
jgi:peptidoglycan/LPS O-acetylase OafA/YrhL